MKRRRIAAALGVVATLAALNSIGGAASAVEGAGQTDQALVRVAEQWRAAYNAGDAAAVASLYTADGYYVSAHVVAHGRAEIQAYFQRGIDAGGHIDAIRILSSGQSGDLGYTVGTYEATNAGHKVRGRNVVVLRRDGDKWRMVAHETVVADQP